MPDRVEQRRFFRVNTEMPVGLDIISSSTTEEAKAVAKQHEYPQDERICQLLSSIQSSDPIVFELVSLINEKISDANLRKLNRNTDDVCRCTLQRVSLSACGMALLDSYEHKVGEKVRLHIELPEKFIHLNATVVDCQKVVQGDYRVRLDFINLSADDEDVLVQYVMLCDAKNRRVHQYNH